jgi:hypothetical protein
MQMQISSTTQTTNHKHNLAFFYQCRQYMYRNFPPGEKLHTITQKIPNPLLSTVTPIDYKKLRCLNPAANYTDRATAACRS